MKKITRIIAGLLTSAIFLQASAFAESIPVLIEQITGDETTTIYEGDINNFDGFQLPWETENNKFDLGYVFDWNNEDSYYQITPFKPQSGANGIQPPTNMQVPESGLKTTLIGGINLDAPYSNEHINLPETEIDSGIEIIDTMDEEPEVVMEVPEVINGAPEPNLTRAAGDDITATTFNTLIAPSAVNGINEPKYSSKEQMKEEISPYSGELTLRCDDLSLPGRNGLDLNIGRVYQSAQANLGQMKYMGIPTNGQGIQKTGLWNQENYYLDRYNLGAGWAFSFPSVQVETEYEYDLDEDFEPFITEHTELYYHTGDGTVYQVEASTDPNGSNLKDYYKKDIHFNQNDTSYSNGTATSLYSMTLADKTKQYFAKDGRLLGIVDRFGNAIKFEHTMQSTLNYIPNGTFAYDNDMWEMSNVNDFYYNYDFGRFDNRSIKFDRTLSSGSSYLKSQPVQVDPGSEYALTLSLNSKYDDDVKIEIEEYDWNYTWFKTTHKTIANLPVSQWTERTVTFNPDCFTRYIRVRIEVAGGTKELYIDNVTMDKPKPLISKITDTIGRTAIFTYSGNILENATGGVTIDITAPDGKTKKLEYEKSVVEYITDFVGEDDQRFYWYLQSADTEGEVSDTGAKMSKAVYQYNGGKGADGNYLQLHTEYNSKELIRPRSYYNKPVLSQVKYRNRTNNYEYETTRKNLGKQGFYDSLRVNKRYDQYAYTENSKILYGGELNKINYTYGGSYNGVSYADETGYPNYEFTNETTFGEQWTSEALASYDTTATNKLKTSNTFTNGVLAKSTVNNLKDGVVTTREYTYDTVFKNDPVKIQNTVSKGTQNNSTYLKLTYNDWGGIASETKDATAEIFNNAEMLEKYTTHYEYDNTFKLPTSKRYFNNVNGTQLTELNEYDSLGRLIKSTDAAGKVTEFAFENVAYPGNVTKETAVDPQGLHNLIGEARTVAYQYDTYGLFPASVKENYEGKEKTTTYTFDYIYGNLKRQVNDDGGVISNIYDAQGRILQAQQPYVQDNGKVFTYTDQYTYRPRTNFAQYGTGVYQLEEVVRFAYYPATGETSICARTQNLYDDAGNLRMKGEVDYSRPVGTSYPLNVTSYFYDNFDRLIKITDCDNQSTSYQYDPLDRMVQVTDPKNNNYFYQYDDVNLSLMTYLKNTSNIEQNHMKQQYDIWGNVLSREVYPNGLNQAAVAESYQYDIAKNVTSQTDPNGNITSYEYDGLNRLIKTTLPDGTSASTSYNRFNKPVSEKVYDADGTAKYARTALANEKGDTTAKFFAWDNKLMYNNSYDYSGKGNVETSNEGGFTYSYDYDYMDNLLTKTAGTSAIEQRYGKFGLGISVASDSSVTGRQFAYDAMGRISQKYQSNFGNTAQYQYTTKNLVSQTKTPIGTSSIYFYDSNDRLEAVSAGGKNYSYTYYDNGMVKSVSYPNGIKTEYTYDNANRVQTMVTKKGSTVINNMSYTHDANGNILTETRNNKTTTYTYDSLNRLKTANYGDADTITYTYDATNNRTSETHSTGDLKEYVYDDFNRLLEIKLNGEVTDTYEYNAKGAVTKHNDKVYTYDQWGKLSGVAGNGNMCYYTYDVNGIRTAKIGTKYFIDPANNVVAEANDDGSAKAEIVYGNQALSRKIGSNWYYYLYNAHGDVIGMTDANGNVVNSYEYDAWGNTLSKTEAVENPIRYAGQYYDEELGQYYLRARYYDPQAGRFTSIDAHEGDIAEPLDLNQYVYCRNNPVAYVDLTGEAVSGYGIVASASVVIGLEGQYLWVTDDRGGFALVAVGGAINSIGASLGGLTVSFPTMPTVKDMEGYGFSLMGSIGNGGAGIVYSGPYQGFAYQYTLGGEIDYWLGGDGTYAHVIFSGNIYSIGNWLKNILNSVLPDKLKIK